MSFIKIYVHFVWSTKNPERFFDSPYLRKVVWQHIKENAATKGIYIDMINGYHDHCHALISMGPEQSPAKIMQLIKGESSHWINENKLTRAKFEWQAEYFAISVSESLIDKVRTYIKNQENHHTTTSFREEYDQFIENWNERNP